MKPVPANADVWVVHQNQVLLFHHRDGVWREEMNLPFNDFVGSAAALSSFTLPDTRVYLNLGVPKKTQRNLITESWVAVEPDPLRLVEVGEDQSHRSQLHTLLSMGKKVIVIAAENPLYFEHSTTMIRVAAFELKHLVQWVSEQKKEVRKSVSTIRFLFQLWQKPSSSYQCSRIAALACTGVTVFLMQMHFNQQTTMRLEHSIRQAQHSSKKVEADVANIAIEQWGIQMSKFGQGKRANVSALNIHWDNEGHVQTIAQLSKERKRLPKGCVLELPTQVVCNTANLAP